MKKILGFIGLSLFLLSQPTYAGWNSIGKIITDAGTEAVAVMKQFGDDLAQAMRSSNDVYSTVGQEKMYSHLDDIFQNKNNFLKLPEGTNLSGKNLMTAYFSSLTLKQADGRSFLRAMEEERGIKASEWIKNRFDSLKNEKANCTAGAGCASWMQGTGLEGSSDEFLATVKADLDSSLKNSDEFDLPPSLGKQVDETADAASNSTNTAEATEGSVQDFLKSICPAK